MSETTVRKYDPIALSAESTVVAEYVPESSDSRRLPVGGRT